MLLMLTLELPSLIPTILISRHALLFSEAVRPLDPTNTMHLFHKMSILRRTRVVLVYLPDLSGAVILLPTSHHHNSHRSILHECQTGQEVLLVFSNHPNQPDLRIGTA
jgi:hypothetical protein